MLVLVRMLVVVFVVLVEIAFVACIAFPGRVVCAHAWRRVRVPSPLRKQQAQRQGPEERRTVCVKEFACAAAVVVVACVRAHAHVRPPALAVALVCATQT